MGDDLDQEVQRLPGSDAVRIAAVVSGQGDDLAIGGDRDFQVVQTAVVNLGQKEPGSQVAGSDFDRFRAEDERDVVPFLGSREAGPAVIEVSLTRRI